MTFLENLKWRFATKAFDKDKKIKQEDLDKILEAIQYVPTSYGLQPFHLVVVGESDVRNKIREAGYDQPQMSDAEYLLIFCARTDVVKRIDDYLEILSGGDEEKKAKMKGLEEMMKGSVKSKSAEEILCWSQKQAYIALGFGLAAAAELKIDSCPMEGFQPDKIDEILDLPDHMKSVVMLAVGYRKEEPRHPKVRFNKDELVEKKG